MNPRPVDWLTAAGEGGTPQQRDDVPDGYLGSKALLSYSRYVTSAEVYSGSADFPGRSVNCTLKNSWPVTSGKV